MTKRCPACGQTLPFEAFGRNRTQADGLSFYCRECNRERSRQWYRESRKRVGRQVRDHSWVPDGFRWCPACERPVAHEDYARNSRTKHGFGSRCKACKAAEDRAGYSFRKYGLTEGDVGRLRADQGDRCLLCADPDPGHVDHDHDSGRIRGLLCERCNLALGLFRDDPAALRAAARYVERHRTAHQAVVGTPTSRRPGPRQSRRPGEPERLELRRRAAGCPSTDLVRSRVAALITSLERPAAG